jgi:alkylation response protein AidB-like acyl-CoA dehydrogenase
MDMHQPGVDVRTIGDLADHHDLCEVFLTDAVVPAENLVGPLHGGWPLTQASLAAERAMLWIDQVSMAQGSIEALVALGREQGWTGDPRFRDAVAALHIDAQAAQFLGYRGFEQTQRSERSERGPSGPPERGTTGDAPAQSLLKVFTSEVIQRITLTGAEWLGATAIDGDGPRTGFLTLGDRSWTDQYLRTFALTIPGGTSEIQRNIIAERVLGLPRR